jgi:glycosidase
MNKLSGVFLFFFVVLFSCKNAEAQKNSSKVLVSNTSLERVEPLNWWIGFKNTSLQLLVKEDNIGNSKPSITYPGVLLARVNKARSENYLFLDLIIDTVAKAGKFDIVFSFEDGSKKTHTYELKSREKSGDAYIGFDSSDAIYLITPDRFSNADERNDINEELKETAIDRTDGYKRHGGDLRGIIEHLPYIYDLGFTAVWPTPVLTNDMPKGSYHGYAMTNFYEVDPRFGTLGDYKKLAHELRKKGMKLIMDQVANHCGLEHWWMKDLPFDDWINYQENFEAGKKYTNTSHRRTVNQDTYASEADKSTMRKGWFVAEMPDLNQENPFMANYIIQNSIWWIETLGLGGIRQDTYPYPDKDFMANWAAAIMKEYPNFSIAGEEWSGNPVLVAYWQRGKKNKDGYASNLKSTMDFPMQETLVKGLLEKETQGSGLVKIYEGLANDFQYATPNDIMIFPDNHDMSRIYTQLNENVTNTKMVLSYMSMMPRIPQMYYGTEILMEDTENPGNHGLIRTDFPGGWRGDAVNAFSGIGLTEAQKDMQSFVSKVLNYRKNSNAIHTGKTMHFAPFKGTYFLFRMLGDEVVVHIMNKNDSKVTIDLNRFKEIGLEGKTVRNIISGEALIWGGEIELTEKGSSILTTKK